MYRLRCRQTVEKVVRRMEYAQNQVAERRRAAEPDHKEVE